MNFPLTSIIVGLACTSCHTYSEKMEECRGVLILDGIEDARIKRDAHQTIIQFIALDEDIVLIKDDASRMHIKGKGSTCKDFGHSFVDSSMREFQGLTYRDEAN